MAPKMLLFLLICLLISFYLESTALVALILLSLFVFASMDFMARKPASKKKEEAKKEQEIIYPVIYEDTGEPPYLFPKKFEIKAYPEAKSGAAAMWSNAIKGVGAIVKMGLWLIFGRPKEPEKK